MHLQRIYSIRISLILITVVLLAHQRCRWSSALRRLGYRTQQALDRLETLFRCYSLAADAPLQILLLEEWHLLPLTLLSFSLASVLPATAHLSFHWCFEISAC